MKKYHRVEVRTYDSVLCFISSCCEVEIVAYRVVSSFLDGRQHDFHVELAPSFLFDPERRLLDCYIIPKSAALTDMMRATRILHAARPR